MELSFETVALLILVVCAVGATLLRFGLPYSVGMAAIALGLALSPLSSSSGIGFTQVAYTALIPPLVFTAAFSLDWHKLRRELALVVSLGIGSVLLSATVAALGMRYLAGWHWSSALMFAAIIAAADPISVSRLCRKDRGIERSRLLISGESLISDSLAAVGVGVVVAVAFADKTTPAWISFTFLTAIGGAILCGVAVAVIALLALGKGQDSLVQIAVTTAVAYGSYASAERLHFSGVVAAIVAGCIVGNWRQMERFSSREREVVETFWRFAAMLASSVVFLIVGVREVRLEIGAIWFVASVAVVLVLVGRACAVYSVGAIFARSDLRMTHREQHVVISYGLRGALPLALGLSIPRDIPGRTEIISVCLIFVAFSVFVGGFTIPQILRRQMNKTCLPQ